MSRVVTPRRGRLHPAPRKLVSTYAEVDGLKIHARISLMAPAQAAPPMVLIHGLGMSGRYMEPTAQQLAADHAVFVPDMPGFGRSEHPDHVLTIPELADAVAAWMRVAGPDRAVFVGNSLGCEVIVDLAARHPEFVERAVLVGSTVDPDGGSVLKQVGRGLLDMWHEPCSLIPVLTLDYFIAGPLRVARTLASAVKYDLPPMLRQVRVPVLVVRGEDDPICPQPWAETMVRLLPQGRLLVLPGAAHAAQFSEPEQLADAIRGFLASS